jgi:hypothetical protein
VQNNEIYSMSSHDYKNKKEKTLKANGNLSVNHTYTSLQKRLTFLYFDPFLFK